MGSSLTVVREVIDDRQAGDCTALADLDGDHRPEIINGAGLDEGAVALRTYGQAGVAGSLLAEPAPGTAFVGACEPADIDGDGDQDLVTVQATLRPSGLVASPAEVVWLDNPGPGGAAPWARHTIGEHADGVALDVVVADVDGDGRPDPISRSEQTLLAWSDRSGTWRSEAIDVPAGRGLTAADLDGDGRDEVIAGGIAAARAADGTWTTSAISGAPSATAAVADFDGDRLPDVALGPFDASGPLAVYRRGPDGWLATTVIADTGGLVHHLAAVDVDYDADPDLITAVLRGAVTIVVNGGQGRLWDPRVIDPDGLFDFAVGDIDGDGDADIAGSNPAGSAPLVLFRNHASDPVVLAGETPRVAVTGGPTPLPTTVTAAPTGAGGGDGASGDGGGDAARGPSTTIAGEPGDGDAGRPADGPSNGVPTEVALGLPTTATAAPRPEAGGATADLDRDAIPLGPPSVDPEVAVLPEVLERRLPAAPDAGRSPLVALAAAALAAALAVVCWPLVFGRSLLPAARSRRLRDGGRAAGAPDDPGDRAAPRGAGPAS